MESRVRRQHEWGWGGVRVEYRFVHIHSHSHSEMFVFLCVWNSHIQWRVFDKISVNGICDRIPDGLRGSTLCIRYRNVHIGKHHFTDVNTVTRPSDRRTVIQCFRRESSYENHAQRGTRTSNRMSTQCGVIEARARNTNTRLKRRKKKQRNKQKNTTKYLRTSTRAPAASAHQTVRRGVYFDARRLSGPHR